MTGFISIYLLLVLLTLATNFNFMVSFINNDVKEEVQLLSLKNKTSGKLLEVIIIFLVILLFPIMITTVMMRGRC